MNYPDAEKHHTCLLRPELLLLFQRTKNIEYAQAKMGDINKQLQEELKLEGLSEKEKEEAKAKRAEENLKKLREFERHLKEAPKYQYNSNVFKKDVQFAPSEKPNIQKDEQLVKDLA